MKTKFLVPMVITAVSGWLAAPAGATVESSFTNINLTIYFQESYTVTGNKETGVVGRTRLNTPQLIKCLAEELEIQLRYGTRLVFELGGNTHLEDSRGNFIADTSMYVSGNLDLEDSLFDGMYFNDTDQESSTIYLGVTINISLPSKGILVSASCMGIERFNASRPSAYNGRQTFRGTINGRLCGEGSVEMGRAYCDGTIGLSGSEQRVVKGADR